MRSSPEVLGLISALTRKIEQSEVFFHPVNICIALNGLQGLDDSSVEVRVIFYSSFVTNTPQLTYLFQLSGPSLVICLDGQHTLISLLLFLLLIEDFPSHLSNHPSISSIYPSIPITFSTPITRSAPCYLP